ncbi:MAG: prephenate dehydrogenase/arogenate dehydrogenase family protein [Rhodospirillaceae bacterium]|nr:prephenate dehydrogenase/arogenate dehydrogenase family protein [Rhodospirillaceae bacterium]
MAHHLKAWFPISTYDPAFVGQLSEHIGSAVMADVSAVASCDIVVLAPPVDQLRGAIRAIRKHLRPGAIVLDVCSVKVEPARIMLSELPDRVEIIGAHPLFGPQSARDGIRGLKIALCPIRAMSTYRIAAFLRAALGLKVFLTTPEAHDQEMATVQGLTHLIAKLLIQMEPLPTRMTTVSYDLLLRSLSMVRHDKRALFHAIELSNPFVKGVRDRFLILANDLRQSLDELHARKDEIAVNKQFDVRPATLSDYDQLCALWEILDEHHRQALPDRFRAPQGPRREATFVSTLIDGPDSAILLAENLTKEIVGFLTVIVRRKPESPVSEQRHYVEVDNLVVKPSERRIGIGRALMNAATAWAVHRGFCALELNVHHFNQEAVDFYSAVGFALSSHRMSRRL